MVARGAVIYSRKARGISRRVVCDWQDAVTGRVLGESYGSYVHCLAVWIVIVLLGLMALVVVASSGTGMFLWILEVSEECTVFIATVAFRDDVWNLVDSMWQWKEIALRIRRP